MAVTINSVTQVGDNTWRLEFSSSTPGATFYIYVDGVLSSIQTSGVYTLSNWHGAEVVEILDTAEDPSPAFPAVLTLGWRRDPDAVSYKIEQWDGSAYVEYCTQAGTADAWQQFTTPALADEAVAQWRITPYDAAGNAGTPTVCSALIVRYPDVPVVEYTYSEITRVIGIAEPAGSGRSGLQFTVKTDNLSTGSTAADQFKLPLLASGAYNFTVYWGDGTSSQINRHDQAAATHTYLAAGTYTVQVEGTCRGWAFQNSGDRLKLLQIQRWGTQFRLGTDEGGYFYGCANLSIAAADAPILESGVSLADCFRGCTTFNSNISGWDVSGVVNMSGMFYGCGAFNQNIGAWNTANVATMADMFRSATVFNQNIGGWNTSKVASMAGMFYGAYAFNQDLSAWDVSACASFASMFVGAASFKNGANTAVNPATGRTGINGWNLGAAATVAAIDCSSMFANKNFNRPLANWNTSKVSNMAGMFGGSGGSGWFNQDISGWDTANVTDMGGMFYQCVFNQPIGNWNVGKVANFYAMFYQSAFNQPIGNWNIGQNTSSVNMWGMFMYCAIRQNFGGWNMTKVTTVELMFAPSCDINEPGTTTNYDALLTGWGAQNVRAGLSLNCGVSQYSDTGADGKAALLAKNWTISDGGPFVVNVWKGTTSANWNTASNWTAGVVPASNHSVYFRPEYNNPCTLDAGVNTRGIEFAAGYTGTVTQGASAITVGAAGWQQHAGTFNGSAAGITLNGAFVQDGGTFNAGSQTINSFSNMTFSGGTFNADTSTVYMRGAYTGSSYIGTITGSPTFYNLSFHHNDPFPDYYTVANTIIVTNTLTFVGIRSGNGNGTSISTGTIEARGNVVCGGAATSGTYTLKFNGTGDQTLTTNNTDSFGGFRISKASGALNFVGDFTISGTFLNENLGGTVNAGTATVTFYSGAGGYGQSISGSTSFYNLALGGFNTSQAIGAGTTLTVLNAFSAWSGGGGGGMFSGGALDIRGNISGDIRSGTTTFLLSGPNNQSINITSRSGSGAWTINKSGGTVTLATALSMSGASLTVTAGVLDLAGYNLTSGTFNIGASGTLKLQGGETVMTPTSNSGTVEYTGATATVKAAWTYHNLTINKPGGTYTFTAGATYTVNGNLVLTGAAGNRLTLQSSAASQWNINPAGNRTVENVAVSYSNNTNAAAIAATGSLDSGNNTNWSFT